MPHDCKGVELKPGDIVYIQAKVRDISQKDADCNCTLEVIDVTEESRTEPYRPQIAMNTKFCERKQQPEYGK